MKLQVLVDNNTYIDHYCYGEPGASFYIEIDDKRILFDTGYSDIFITNAEKLNVNLKEITNIVLSHGHDDHTGGLKYLDNYMDISNIELISHVDTFYNKKSGSEICGAPFSLEEIDDKVNFKPTKEAYKISENCIFLGEIPAYNDFEKRRVLGKKNVNGEWIDDYMLDDSAICCKTNIGIFIITGCSHSGICNIIEHAKKVTKEDKVAGVIGGFHLFELDERGKKTIEYFRKNKIDSVYPSHCTSLKIKAEILKYFEFNEVGVGFEIKL
ncbi:MBL fold metallo-hydrolase [Miniphocaeibacter massiliensis]|uniref:MBL fold metallo-hydrolase n=1 Tax=Miniphocaeibacter massiliensis TaxID=2041841 RepID=UPI000C1B9A83|nr:MBL fold metallo-hydrolase [Miniphocaeibacter massiliensis]